MASPTEIRRAHRSPGRAGSGALLSALSSCLLFAVLYAPAGGASASGSSVGTTHSPGPALPAGDAPATVDAAGRTAGPSELAAAAPDLAPEVLDLALATLACSSDPAIADAPTLAIIDYSLPSTDPRLWLFDRERGDLLLHTLVAHGVGTGENFATRFSNVEGTRASSLGLFRGGEVYRGRNGISLRLDGLDPAINDRARARTIVLHGAWYVSPDFVREHGRLGRSWGCPAVEPKYSSFVIDHLKEGGALFVHGDDRSWLAKERNDRCIRDRMSAFEAGFPPEPRTAAR